MDGLERNAKKEEERAGVGDDANAVGVGLVEGRDIPEDTLVVVVPKWDGAVTTRGVDDLRVSVNHLTTMGVKSLWKLLTPVGRPVLYFFPIAL